MVIASVLGWIQLGRIFLIVAPIWAGFVAFFPPKPVAWKNDIMIHDQLAQVLCDTEKEDPDSFWVEGVGTENLNISLQGVAISYWLKGCDRGKIASQADQKIFVIGEEGLQFPKYFQQQNIVVYQLPSIIELRAFQQEKRISGYDFSVLFHPEEKIILY